MKHRSKKATKSGGCQRSASEGELGPPDSQLLREHRRLALKGDRDSALDLLQRVEQAIGARKPIPSEIQAYLYAAIRRYLAGTHSSMDDALGVSKPKHREAGKRKERQEEIAVRALTLMETYGTKKAIETAARELNVDPRTVERAVHDLRHACHLLFPAEARALQR